MALTETYEHTILALGALALLMFCQLIIVDLVGIKQKHLPGASIEADHSSFLFRSSRAVANINESIGVFILLVLFCILSGASPQYTSYAAWGYVTARFFYTLCYYFNFQILRSICFSLSLFALLALFLIGLLKT